MSEAEVFLVVSQLSQSGVIDERYRAYRQDDSLVKLPDLFPDGLWMKSARSGFEDPKAFRHWAVKVREKYYELGRDGEQVVLEVNTLSEPRRKIMQIDKMGWTHYTDEEVRDFGIEIAKGFTEYKLLRQNCQTLSTKLLVQTLCQDRSHEHDHYIFAPAFEEIGFSQHFKERFLLYTLIHSSDVVGLAYASTEYYFNIPWLGTASFCLISFFLVKWMIFRPLGFFGGVIAVIAAYIVFVQNWGIS